LRRKAAVKRRSAAKNIRRESAVVAALKTKFYTIQISEGNGYVFVTKALSVSGSEKLIKHLQLCGKAP
jgi:hypothetical protein